MNSAYNHSRQTLATIRYSPISDYEFWNITEGKSVIKIDIEGGEVNYLRSHVTRFIIII